MLAIMGEKGLLLGDIQATRAKATRVTVPARLILSYSADGSHRVGPITRDRTAELCELLVPKAPEIFTKLIKL